MQPTKKRAQDLERFYDLLENLEAGLGGARKLSECSGRDGWPQRGIYFFQEHGEQRVETGKGLRIVRVGTHALKAGSRTRLWTRLSQHKGVVRSGAGNHRGSIFRLIIGAALIRKKGLDYPTWGRGSSACRDTRDGEVALEQAVTEVIGGMPFLWLDVDDEASPDSLRGYLERNSIALLSNYEKEAIDPASVNWLGRHSDRPRVQKSGLWNSNHVDEGYDPSFLDVLEGLVKKPDKRP